MSTRNNPLHAETLQGRFALRVTARLSAGAEELPHDIAERLRVARQQALARRRQALLARPATPASARGRAGASRFGDEGLGFWGRLASATLVMTLAVGLVTISIVQDDDRAVEVADLDAALLTDDLPPAAYSDPGFLQYLKAGAEKSSSGR